MNIIGIETSSLQCSAALLKDGKNIVEKSETEPNVFSEKLSGLVDSALTESGLSVNSIEAVAVSIGPGSFTGVRVGLAFAKGLSFSLDIPVTGITAFESMTINLDTDLYPVCCIVTFKGDKLAYKIINSPDEQVISDSGIAGFWNNIEQLNFENISSVTGDFDESDVKRLNIFVPETVNIRQIKPKASDIALAGLRKIQNGIQDDMVSLEPLYAHTMKFRERQSKFHSK